MTDALRVASYNLRDLKDDVTAAARVIRALEPDVLCLQEVPRHPFSGHRIVDLASRVGLYWPGGHHGSGGTTVLTSLRVDVHSQVHRRLPVPLRDRTRGYCVCVASLPGGPRFTAVSLHLSLTPQERTRHAEQVLAVVRTDQPLVVAGDFNEQQDGAAWRAIGARLRPVTPALATFPAKAPRRRLDVIFASQHFQEAGQRPEPAPAEADLIAATDHRPVWADLRLTGG